MSRDCYSRLKCLHNGSIQDIPLDGVDVDVSIIDVHAKAVMSQRFTNPFSTAVNAGYTFSMLATSAVCGFEMIRGDGTKVIGDVQEKKAARKAYEAAVARGQTASLGEEQTKDLLSIKVGNILPSETVTIKVTFLIPLTDDEKKDQIRFTFPRAYTERYGTPPTADAANMTSKTGMAQNFTINVSIQMANSIKSISCPSSYPIVVSMGRPDGAPDSTVPDSNFASVKLTNPTPDLDRDFILVVTAAGLDSPRCFSESSGETTAVGLTFVPQFNLPDSQSGMEYIFLVDRSGSMDGTPIELVRQALIVLLRGLPSKRTKFNIFSFGDETDSLWPTSKDYTQQTLEEATAHVDTMTGDYGGTEIPDALRAVFAAVPKDRKQPVSVFLLTDGDTWDIESCQDIIREALATPGPFVRIFTVGIGDDVSTDTVESIARAGNGFSIYVQDDEPMAGKLSRLVRASRVPPIRDVRLVWPDITQDADDFVYVDPKPEQVLPEPRTKVNLSNANASDSNQDAGPPPKPAIDPATMFVPGIQQAPLNVPGLFPGTRTQIYAIVSSSALRKNAFPTSLQVCGTVADTGTPVELGVTIVPSPSPSIIHTLAARALITDREDGKHAFPPSISSQPSVLEAYLEADIIRLGTKYGLTSKHTSYVAIDERENKDRPEPGDSEEVDLDFYGLGSEDEDEADCDYECEEASEADEAPMSLRRFIHYYPDDDCDEDPGFGLVGSYPSRSAPAPQEESSVESESDDEDDRRPAPHGVIDAPMTAIARLQQFDGSFLLSEKLLDVIGANKTIDEIRQALSDKGASDEAIATCLALLWLEKEALEEGQDMIEKALEWLNDNSEMSQPALDELKQAVKGVLAQ